MPAVLVSMVPKGNELCFLLEVRSQQVKQPGEICFPGGHLEPGETPEQTAVRETAEELGIPASAIRILGKGVSEEMSSGRQVQAVPALIDPSALDGIVLSREEVADVFCLPIRWLRNNPPAHYDLSVQADGWLPEKLLHYLKGYPADQSRRFQTWYWEYDGHGIWGLTARILKKALESETVRQLEQVRFGTAAGSREVSMTVRLPEIRYTVVRSSRKTYAIEVKVDGTVLVRVPRRCTDRMASELVHQHETWIRRQLEKKQAAAERSDAEGRLSEEEIRKLMEQAMQVIPERVAYYAPKVGVTYGRITIRNQKTRWGSCSAKGNLNFNCLLMLTPPEVIDSVVVHELCHRLEMNHSKRFYAEVLRVFPDYPKWNRWLKANGPAILRRMTG